jgi:hypothetical protein
MLSGFAPCGSTPSATPQNLTILQLNILSLILAILVTNLVTVLVSVLVSVLSVATALKTRTEKK